MLENTNTHETMILFDLDGTLWDSAENVAASWNEVTQKELEDFRILTAEDIHSVMGKTMADIARIIFGELGEERMNEVADKCNVYEVAYIEKHGGVLFPNVRETLKKLHEQGYPMGIISNCQEGYIRSFLISMEMQEYFCDYEEWGRTGRPKGENIKLLMDRNGCKNAIYLGDTAGDEKSARMAGIPFIHAAYGFGKAEAPDKSIGDFSELEEIAHEMLPL